MAWVYHKRGSEKMEPTEPQEKHTGVIQARLGSYLVIPLKYEQNGPDTDWLKQFELSECLSTMDLTEPVKELFVPNAPSRVGVRYHIPHDMLINELLNEKDKHDCTFQVHKVQDGRKTKRTFDFFDAWLYVFDTQVALLCLGLLYSSMDTLLCICNPGFVENNAEYSYVDKAGKRQDFSLKESLDGLCERAGLKALFTTSSPMILEANTYNLAVMPQRFRDLETIRKITFNQHRMSALDLETEDQSEDDVRYVYSVRDQETNSYRWGCCVSSQTLSYVVGGQGLKLEEELQAQAQDGLPLLALALHEKYTCVRFSQLVAALPDRKSKRLRELKQMMLDFRAFGVVTPANISRWNNVKKIYEYILDTNGIPESIDDIHHKLSILIERQHEIETSRNDAIGWVLTLFGITSILDSILSIIQILAEGSDLEWNATILSSLIMFIMMVVVIVTSWWKHRLKDSIKNTTRKKKERHAGKTTRTL